LIPHKLNCSHHLIYHHLLGLKWEDINFFNKTISINRAIRKGVISTPKTENSIRTIDMLPVVEDAIIAKIGDIGTLKTVLLGQ